MISEFLEIMVDLLGRTDLKRETKGIVLYHVYLDSAF
jgi:hypothetical protein